MVEIYINREMDRTESYKKRQSKKKKKKEHGQKD